MLFVLGGADCGLNQYGSFGQDYAYLRDSEGKNKMGMQDELVQTSKWYA